LSDSAVAFQGLGGFGVDSTTQRLVRNVPALNGYGRVNFGNFSLVGEYVGATQSFDQRDLSFNDRGARPQAWDTQAAYFFEVVEKPSSFFVGYAGTSDSLALGLPENRFSAGFKTSLWRNTIQAIEVRRDINYSSGSTAFGPTNAEGMPTGAAALARSATTVTAMVGAYY